MSSPAPTPLWVEHRMIAEAVGQAVSDAITAAIGTNVDLGMATTCDPATMLAGRPLPIRALVVHFHRPLRDAMIFVTALKEEVVRPLVEVAAAAAIASLDIPTDPDQHGAVGSFTIDEAVEYATIEEALEQCDALFLEATYGMDTPTGALQMVLGTGLLESASCFLNAMADPFAEEPACRLPGEEDDGSLMLGDQIGGLDEVGTRYEMRDGDMAAQSADSAHNFGTAPAPAASAPAGAAGGGGIDALDAMLAQHEADERAAAAILGEAPSAPGRGLAATASANAAAASDQTSGMHDRETAARWTQLLSGVEVELSAELGRTDLALGDITSLTADSVLTLDQLIHEPVGVFVNGTRYATARLVVVDGEYGIEILEVVDQSVLLNSLAA